MPTAKAARPPKQTVVGHEREHAAMHLGARPSCLV